MWRNIDVFALTNHVYVLYALVIAISKQLMEGSTLNLCIKRLHVKICGDFGCLNSNFNPNSSLKKVHLIMIEMQVSVEGMPRLIWRILSPSK